METFVRFENTILLSYNKTYDCYELVEDSGRGFPYEFYDELTLDGVDYYALYLDYKERYPSVSTDQWLDIQEVEQFLLNAQSTTEEGSKRNQKLRGIIQQYLKSI